jgi:hypothetical protein
MGFGSFEASAELRDYAWLLVVWLVRLYLLHWLRINWALHYRVSTWVLVHGRATYLITWIDLILVDWSGAVLESRLLTDRWVRESRVIRIKGSSAAMRWWPLHACQS